jgi:hypothetical protein
MKQNIVSTKVFFNNHCRFEITGEEIEFPGIPDYKFIIHKDIKEAEKDLLEFGENYSVTEIKSGANVITGAADALSAVKLAEVKIHEMGLTKFYNRVERFIDLKKQILENQIFNAFIECNELKTNDEIDSFIIALERQGLKLL